MPNDRALAPAGLALTAALVLAACSHGTLPQKFPPANHPTGVKVAVRVRGDSADRVGELYAADSAGLVLADARVSRIAWPVIEAMDVEGLDDRYDVLHGEAVTPVKWSRLALVSRFPQGLSGELLARVLAMRGQAALAEVP
ncbi:MAG: hypothetical protein ACJ8AO_14230 [Gemmatimonadaceae bacterium]